MKQISSIILVCAVCVCAAAAAQTPKPGDPPQTGAQNPAPASSSSANPFPEDTTSVPVMPTTRTPAIPEGTYSAAEAMRVPLPGDDLDPVRSPDDPERDDAGAQDSVSSSLKGLENLLPTEDDNQPGKRKKPDAKQPKQQEASTKDIEVGNYYLETKNWRAAFSRFQSAMVLDPENPAVYWGMAEAERHLGEFSAAKSYYLKVVDFDPDSRMGKDARKALKDPAVANAKDKPPAAPGAESPKQ